VDHSKKDNLLRLEQIDDPVRVEEDLSHIIAIGFGDAAPDPRMISQSFDGGKETLDELSRVVG
jgi:hypothetical protein